MNSSAVINDDKLKHCADHLRKNAFCTRVKHSRASQEQSLIFGPRPQQHSCCSHCQKSSASFLHRKWSELGPRTSTKSTTRPTDTHLLMGCLGILFRTKPSLVFLTKIWSISNHFTIHTPHLYRVLIQLVSRWSRREFPSHFTLYISIRHVGNCCRTFPATFERLVTGPIDCNNPSQFNPLCCKASVALLAWVSLFKPPLVARGLL